MLSRYTQLFRYAVTGLLTNSAGYLVYFLITLWGMGPKASITLLYCFGIALGYFGNRLWTFKDQGKVSRSLVKYVFAHLVGYAINFFILSLFVDKWGYPHQWVQGAAILIVAVFSFFMLKFFVFPATQPRSGPA